MAAVAAEAEEEEEEEDVTEVGGRWKDESVLPPVTPC